MNKLQYGFMLYLSLILLAGMGKAAKGINKKDHLTKSKQDIVYIILRYLDIDTWFVYRLLNKACYQKLRPTIITAIAFHQYSVYLTTPDHTLKKWDQLHQFVHNPLDSTVIFPILPPVSFHGLLPPAKATEPELVAFFRKTEGFAAIYADVGKTNIWAYTGPWSKCTTTLPLIYDPNQNILHLYPIGENEVVYSQHIRFPAMLILIHSEKEPRKEWLSTWSIIRCDLNAKRNGYDRIFCKTKNSEAIVFCFTTEGIVESIQISVVEPMYKVCFFSNKGDKGTTFIDPNGYSDYSEIRALYFPSKD